MGKERKERSSKRRFFKLSSICLFVQAGFIEEDRPVFLMRSRFIALLSVLGWELIFTDGRGDKIMFSGKELEVGRC